MNITESPANPANYTVGRKRAVDMLVLHVEEGSQRGTAGQFRDPNAHASAHYGIGKDGSVVRFVDEANAAWHAGNWDVNHRSIGIEQEGNVADPANFTQPMLASLRELVLDIAARHGIPIDRAHIIGHNEVPDPHNPSKVGGANGHTDPGPFFPWEDFMGSLLSSIAEPSSTTSAGA